MAKIKDIIKLLRPNQWYKNLLIFIAIIFSKNLLNLSYLKITFQGFVMLIIISSANYIFNDLVDLKKDILNPEKKDRPIASGKISKKLAIILFLSFLVIGLISAYKISLDLFYIVLGIVLISTLYTFLLKNIVFADLLAISSNFVLRAVSGAVIIDVFISPWLVIGIFFFALFLVTGKRYSELNYLNKNATKHRIVLKDYSKDITLSLFNIFMASLFIVFALYSFSSEHKLLIWIIPLFMYLILRYYQLIIKDGEIARNPEKAVKDPCLLIGGLIFIILSIILIML